MKLLTNFPKNFKIGLVSFLLIGVIGILCYFYAQSQYISTNDVRIDGTMVGLSARISGHMDEIMVKEGDLVLKGQVLARINQIDLIAQLKQAEANLAVAKAAYDQTVAGLRSQEIERQKAIWLQTRIAADNAGRELQRYESLYSKGAISSSAIDQVRSNYQIATESMQAAQEGYSLAQLGSREEEIRAAEAKVKQAEAALRVAENALNDSTIRSPVNGIVAKKYSNSGEFVPAGTQIFSIVDSEDIWLNIRVEEQNIGKLQLGQEVTFWIDGYGKKEFKGKISEISIATSSTFALIPSENAAGYFTKVVQRVPIKVTLPAQEAPIVFRLRMQGNAQIRIN